MVGFGTKIGTALSLAAFLGVSAIALPMTATSVSAGENVSTLSRGGLLYDKWYKIVGVEENDETHPAYPDEGKKGGTDTWRCKECHGWDYKGVDGAYGDSSHFTGIKGVWGMRGADTADIIAVIEDDTHELAGLMGDADLQDLANFISEGLIDASLYINADKSLKGGDADQGAAVFNTICSRCHREDGTRPKDMGHTLGFQIADNPWEVMHKIMNGHPGQNMPSMRAFGPEVAADIMAYLTTLTTEK